MNYAKVALCSIIIGLLLCFWEPSSGGNCDARRRCVCETPSLPSPGPELRQCSINVDGSVARSSSFMVLMEACIRERGATILTQKGAWGGRPNSSVVKRAPNFWTSNRYAPQKNGPIHKASLVSKYPWRNKIWGSFAEHYFPLHGQGSLLFHWTNNSLKIYISDKVTKVRR